MKIRFLLIFISLLGFQSKGQIDPEFISYLVISDLNSEHHSYLNEFEKKYGLSDSLIFYKTKFSLYTNQYDSFESLFSKCALCLKDTSFVNYSTSHLIKYSLSNTLRIWKIDSINGLGLARNSLLRRSYDLSVNPNLNSSFLPKDLSYHFLEYKDAYNKKAWVAGLLSTVIPGAGKLYIGRTNSFLGAFALNLAHGIIAYEAINKKGIKHPYSIISTGVFGVFYLSNIFGSVHDLKRVRNEKRKHFLYEVADYQSAGLFLYE